MMTSHLEEQRINMIKQQLRACDVLNDDILNLFLSTEREDFVPSAYLDTAFADTHIPLAHGQQMMTPMEEGTMIQALAIQPHETLLEIGTGSGYVTSLLANLAEAVVTVDIFDDFTQAAAAKLKALKIDNVKFETGDAAKGWENGSPFDVIAITGSMPLLPKNFLNQLRVGGRLFVVLGDAPCMSASLFTRTTEDSWDEQKLFETDLIALVNAPRKPEFEF